MFIKSNSISPPQNKQTKVATSSAKLVKATSNTEKTFLNNNNSHNTQGRSLKPKICDPTHSKAKTTFFSKSSEALLPKNSRENGLVSKSEVDQDDAYMSFNNSICSNTNKQFSKISHSNNNILKSNNCINILNNNQKTNLTVNQMTISCNDLLAKKYELDSSYMDQSILMNKISPSNLENIFFIINLRIGLKFNSL